MMTAKKETAKIEVLYREFPFIERYVGREALTKAPTVQRVDINLLNQVATNASITEEHVDDVARYILIGDAGVELGEANQKSFDRETKFHLLKPSTWLAEYVRLPGETVYQCIRRLGNPNQIRYVLEIRHIFYSAINIMIVVHKVPSNPDWFSALLDQIAVEIHEQLAAIDNV